MLPHCAESLLLDSEYLRIFCFGLFRATTLEELGIGLKVCTCILENHFITEEIKLKLQISHR